MLLLIVTIMFSALCFAFDCYHGDYRTLCSFSLLRLFLARSAFFFIATMMISSLFVVLIVTMMISALCVLFYCYDDD